jgi:hypothetical protein
VIDYPMLEAISVEFVTGRGQFQRFTLQDFDLASMWDRIKEFWRAKDLVWVRAQHRRQDLEFECEPNGAWAKEAAAAVVRAKNPPNEFGYLMLLARTPSYELRFVDSYLGTIPNRP